MIYWRIVTDDFGDEVIVTEINYPNPRYFTRIVGPFAGMMVVKGKKK